MAQRAGERASVEADLHSVVPWVVLVDLPWIVPENFGANFPKIVQTFLPRIFPSILPRNLQTILQKVLPAIFDSILPFILPAILPAIFESIFASILPSILSSIMREGAAPGEALRAHPEPRTLPDSGQSVCCQELAPAMM